MAITSLGTLGTVGSVTANQASVVLTTSAAAEVGHYVIIIVAVDNNATADGDEGAVTGVVDNAAGGTNTWAKLAEFCNAQGAAQGGVTVSMWGARIVRQINSSGTITVSFSNATSRDASAVTAWEFNLGSGQTLQLDGTPVTQAIDANTLTSGAAMGITTANAERLRVRGIGCESNSATAITVTTNWTAFTHIRSSSGTSAVNVFADGEFRIVTATTGNSDPTHSTSADWASVYVTLQEVPINVSLTATNLTVGSPVLGPARWLDILPAATNLTTAPAYVEVDPDITTLYNLSASNLVVGSPALAATALHQKHAIATAGKTAGSPVEGTPSLGIRHNLTANGKTTSSPALGTPTLSQKHALATSGKVVGSPALGTSALHQKHVLLPANRIVSSPVLATPALVQNYHLTANGKAVGSPTLGHPTVGVVHVLTANGKSVAAPTFGTPLLRILIPVNLTVGSPTRTAAVLVQNHHLTALGKTVTAPHFAIPTLHFRQPLGDPPGLTVRGPRLDRPRLYVENELHANGLTVGSPQIDLAPKFANWAWPDRRLTPGHTGPIPPYDPAPFQNERWFDTVTGIEFTWLTVDGPWVEPNPGMGNPRAVDEAELIFPPEPTIGQRHSQRGKSWVWIGRGWAADKSYGVDAGSLERPGLAVGADNVGFAFIAGALVAVVNAIAKLTIAATRITSAVEVQAPKFLVGSDEAIIEPIEGGLRVSTGETAVTITDASVVVRMGDADEITVTEGEVAIPNLTLGEAGGVGEAMSAVLDRLDAAEAAITSLGNVNANQNNRLDNHDTKLHDHAVRLNDLDGLGL
jgi:hypothetical protein